MTFDFFQSESVGKKQGPNYLLSRQLKDTETMGRAGASPNYWLGYQKDVSAWRKDAENIRF
jgi:hypothetical protein